MLQTYGILGAGDGGKYVIEEALKELGTDNDFIIGCPSKLTPALERVLDWLDTNETAYSIIHDGLPSSNKYLENAVQEYETPTKNVTVALLRMLKEEKGTLLLIWDDGDLPEMERICVKAADMGIKILDLTNGLVPVTVLSAEVEEESTPPATEIEVEPFSREEMLSMSLGVLRKTAKVQGVAIGPHTTKSQIVDAILSARNEEPEEEVILPPVDLGTFHIVSSATNDRAITSSTETCMLTAVFPSGVIMSRPASVSEVKVLFGFESLT